MFLCEAVRLRQAAIQLILIEPHTGSGVGDVFRAAAHLLAGWVGGWIMV